MFNTSTKVAVLASSSTRNLGPKRGSIGYATVDSHVSYGSYLLNQDTTDGVMLAHSKVAFMRYGLGKERPKYEYKPVLNVFPIIDRAVKTEEINKTVSKVISKFNKEDFENRFWLNSKVDIMGSTKVDVCIMAPILTLGIDLRTCSNLEFSAWFNSMLNTYSIKTSIAKMNIKCYLDKLSRENRMIATNLRHCTGDAGYKHAYIDDIAGSPDTRAAIVEFLRLMYSITNSVLEKQIREGTQQSFIDKRYKYKKGDIHAKSAFFRVITYNLFSDNTFKTIKRAVPGGESFGAVTRVGQTKEILESMAYEIAKKDTE